MTLEQAKFFFNTLLQSLPDVFILCFDHDLRYIEAQGSGLGFSDFSRETVIGRTLWETMPETVFQAIEPRYRAALAGNRAQITMSFQENTYDVTILPVCDDSGHVQAGMAILRNATAQRAVSIQMRRFEKIVEYAADAMLVYDLHGIIQYANPAAATFYHLSSPADLIGRKGSWADDPEESITLSSEIVAGLEQHGVWRGRGWIMLPDTERILGEIVVFRLFDDQNSPIGSAAILRNVTKQIREEEQRAAIQQQIIDGQEATLRELSTPLIPLADNVVVMPIIGVIDGRRAQQIMETLLEGIATHQADIALLDISGVHVVDTQVADALLRVAQAAKLLGTRIVLTGIHAEVAQTIIHLGANMSDIITRANLQEGLHYALSLAGDNNLYHGHHF